MGRGIRGTGPQRWLRERRESLRDEWCDKTKQKLDSKPGGLFARSSDYNTPARQKMRQEFHDKCGSPKAGGLFRKTSDNTDSSPKSQGADSEQSLKAYFADAGNQETATPNNDTSPVKETITASLQSSSSLSGGIMKV